jgi:hypothetical protein
VTDLDQRIHEDLDRLLSRTPLAPTANEITGRVPISNRRPMILALAAVLLVLAAVVGAVVLRQAGGDDEVPTGPTPTTEAAAPDLFVFMNPFATDVQVEAIRDRLTTAPEVLGVDFVDQDQTYREFLDRYGADPGLAASVYADDLAASFRVTVVDHDLTAATALVTELSGSPGILEVDTDPMLPVPEEAPNDVVLPRLVVDLPGWGEVQVAVDDLVEADGGSDRRVVYQGDEDVLPLLAVLTTTGSYGFGSGTETIEVAGRSAQLSSAVGSTQEVGWVDRGETMALTGYGLAEEDLIAAAETLVRGQDGAWEVGTPPAGLTERFRSGRPSFGAERFHEVTIVGPGDRSAVLDSETGAAAYWDAVTDVLFGAENAEAVTVHGQPGLLTGTDGEYRVDWLERGGTVAMRMDLCCGLTHDEVDDILGNLTEVDIATWRDLTGSGSAPRCPEGHEARDRDGDGILDTCRLVRD